MAPVETVITPATTLSNLNALLEKFRPAEAPCRQCGQPMKLRADDLYRSSGGRSWFCGSCSVAIGEALYLLQSGGSE